VKVDIWGLSPAYIVVAPRIWRLDLLFNIIVNKWNFGQRLRKKLNELFDLE
jgi:hypothetical protein